MLLDSVGNLILILFYDKIILSIVSDDKLCLFLIILLVLCYEFYYTTQGTVINSVI